MGAAFADKELHDSERKVVEEHLASLLPDGELSNELRERISNFSMSDFDLGSVAANFADDSKEDKRSLIDIVASVHASDDEYDLAEDDFLMSVASALGLNEDDVSDHALDYEEEELKEQMAKLRPSPPPIPGS